MNQSKGRPILLNSISIQAILEGRKTQTRRVLKFPSSPGWLQFVEHQSLKAVYPMPMGGWVFWDSDVGQDFSDRAYPNGQSGFCCPYGQNGDLLWARETWQLMVTRWDYDVEEAESIPKTIPQGGGMLIYKVDDPKAAKWWRPSIFMPRWASRIILSIVKTRIERLQAISETDAKAEGVAQNWIGDNANAVCSIPPEYENEYRNYAELGSDNFPCNSARESYQTLWDRINKKRGWPWAINPWVWVIEFKVI